jgi:GNAT superfamily N-acetyltransferase
MELRMPTAQQLRTVYARDLKASFPAAELKPLSAIERLAEQGRYRPWCLFDGEEIAGACFLWQGDRPGWELLDYLCIAPARRNGGLGALLLEKMREAEPNQIIFAETETPEYAADPAMALRRQNFYRRCGARFAGFQAEVFGVCYDLIYWADAPVEDAALLARYDAVYRGSFPPDKYERYIRIPRDPGAKPMPQVPWNE